MTIIDLIAQKSPEERQMIFNEFIKLLNQKREYVDIPERIVCSACQVFVDTRDDTNEEDSVYFSPDKTMVKSISPTTIELSVEMGDKYASYFADKLTYLFSNSTPDSVNISKVRNEIRKELIKANFRNMTISIPRAYCVYDY